MRMPIITGIVSYLKEMEASVNELKWANIYHDTIGGYKWYNINSISLGRWAVGYNYAYILVRTLNEIKPASILECGLGQSTKIIASYMNYYMENKIIKYDVVEQDSEWINFFGKNESISKNVNIYQREIVSKEKKGGKFYYYNDFKSVIKGKRYNLLSIDGPWGGENISRTDVIEYIPDILADDFVIIMDDCERKGEYRSFVMLRKKLETMGIKYNYSIYRGEKNVAVITSDNLKFLTTM